MGLVRHEHTSTSLAAQEVIPACVELADLFQHPLIETETKAKTGSDMRRQRALINRAETVCLECPMMVECLYRAVVDHDVAGYVAGTTRTQREQIRADLGITVNPDDLDAFVGVKSGRRVNHEQVLRLRATYPGDSLDSIARRLGCSLSTVKRHLRKARCSEPAPRKKTHPKPTVEQVLTAYARTSEPATRAA